MADDSNTRPTVSFSVDPTPSSAPLADMPPRAADAHLAAGERILHATARRLTAAGAVNLSLQDVANDAGVSKGLIHYHFHDKTTLLARLVEWLTEELVHREGSALTGTTRQTVIDALWTWLESELARGHIRVLVELSQYDAPAVREAIRDSARARRQAATGTIESLFSILGLRPRLPHPLLADVAVTFLDGLAIDTGLAADGPRRIPFDVFWLSLLSLAE